MLPLRRVEETVSRPGGTANGVQDGLKAGHVSEACL